MPVRSSDCVMEFSLLSWRCEFRVHTLWVCFHLNSKKKLVPMKLVIRNLDQLVQVCDAGQQFKVGKEQNEVQAMTRRADGCGCFIAIDDHGLIHSLGYDDDFDSDPGCQVIDGRGCSLIPGLIDPHTHPVWAGDRLFEFDLKMQGSNYLDIHSKGGGIYYTVNETRAASEQQLRDLFLQRLDMFLSHGTTLVEAKTGYGLDLETEHKMLRVIGSAQKIHQIEIVTNLLAGHAVPKGRSSGAGVREVIQIMQELSTCKDIPVIDFVDVFCEKGVYDVNESREIVLSGKKLLSADIAFHGEELSCSGSAEMAADVAARSISHCEFISRDGIAKIAASKTVAIICPTTAFLLRLSPAPVRDMIESEVILAIASDFNPNAFCFSLAYAMQIAVIHSKFSLNEALVATTINAAFALKRSHSHGSLERGKVADMVLLQCSNWQNLIYQMGQSRDLIKAVIKRGKVVNN